MALVGAAGEGPREETPDRNPPSPQGEKTAVQKQTYTRWMNVFLKRCDPPLQVQDLFVDLGDGRALLALLEQLSGCQLVYRFRPSTHRIFRLNNIAKALAFLDDRHVKLLGVEASAVADGVPHVVLNLLWNIISFFQIQEATGGLKRRLSSSLSSLPPSPSPSPRGPLPPPGGPYSSATLPPRRRRPGRGRRLRSRPLESLLLWVQRRTARLGVEVWDFGRSWRSGLAFLALIQSIAPGLVDLGHRPPTDPHRTLEEAFRVARDRLGVPALLEPRMWRALHPTSAPS
ncbi:calmin [Gadus macrocephalus]|uniref:calmin n=1 Tax=Gadus macrocephalus TaxID=80720 RepID=UPI0028CB903D|nr:calmin [Gadus macrocephalus]